MFTETKVFNGKATNSKTFDVQQLSGCMHIDIVRYQLRVIICNFLSNELHIVSISFIKILHICVQGTAEARLRLGDFLDVLKLIGCFRLFSALWEGLSIFLLHIPHLHSHFYLNQLSISVNTLKSALCVFVFLLVFFLCFISSFSNFVFCVIGILLCPKLGARYSVVVLSYCLSYFFFVYCFKSGRSGFREWFPFLPCCLYLTLRYEVCSFLKAAYICSIRTLLAKCPICNHIRIHDTHVSLEFKVKNING